MSTLLFSNPDSDSDSEEQYKVEAILNHRKKRGKVEYLVLWKDDEHPTWIDEDSLSCPVLLTEYNNVSDYTVDLLF